MLRKSTGVCRTRKPVYDGLALEVTSSTAPDGCPETKRRGVRRSAPAGARDDPPRQPAAAPLGARAGRRPNCPGSRRGAARRRPGRHQQSPQVRGPRRARRRVVGDPRNRRGGIRPRCDRRPVPDRGSRRGGLAFSRVLARVPACGARHRGGERAGPSSPRRCGCPDAANARWGLRSRRGRTGFLGTDGSRRGRRAGGRRPRAHLVEHGQVALARGRLRVAVRAALPCAS